MEKKSYPAVFTKEGHLYAVEFPDLEGCYTCGNSAAHAVEMAVDVLSLTLYSLRRDGEELPSASGIGELRAEGEGSFVKMIEEDERYLERN